MTVSKRTRFEILRRDGFKCHYCGKRADETELHVDHFVPVALGGTDDPENLVTACEPCNQGKSSVPVDAPMLAELDEKVAIYRAAQRKAMRELEAELDDQAEFEAQVVDMWNHYVPTYRKAALGDSFAQHVYDWHARGVPLSAIEKGIRIAVSNGRIAWSGKWDYATGVVRNTVEEAERRFDIDPETGNTREYDRGYEDGSEAQCAADVAYCMARHLTDDLLTSVVDGREIPAALRHARKAA